MYTSPAKMKLIRQDTVRDQPSAQPGPPLATHPASLKGNSCLASDTSPQQSSFEEAAATHPTGASSFNLTSAAVQRLRAKRWKDKALKARRQSKPLSKPQTFLQMFHDDGELKRRRAQLLSRFLSFIHYNVGVEWMSHCEHRANFSKYAVQTHL
jgi:hypothetical protein